MNSHRRALAVFEAIAVVGATSSILFFLVLPMLPIVMQDELVYRWQSVYLGFEELDFPAYTLAIASRFAEANPESWYVVIKLINALAAGLATGVLYWSLRRLVRLWITVVSAASFLLVPAMFQASFYMPDMLASASLLSAISLLVVGVSESRSPRSPIWIVAALPLALALLSKPHALFAVFGVLTFALAHFFGSRKFSPALITVALAMMGRLLVGFMIAGPAGFNLIGNNYSSSLFAIQQELLPSTELAQGLHGSISNAIPADSQNFLLSFGWEFAQLFAVFGLVSLGLIIPILTRVASSQSLLLLGSVLLVTIAGVAAFEVLVGARGDDHSGRILTRHFEYLLPLVIGLGLHELRKRGILGRQAVLVHGLALVAILGFGSYLLVTLPRYQVSDGVMVLLAGFWSNAYVWSLVALSVLLWLALIFKPEWPAVVVVVLFLGALGVFANEARTSFSTETPNHTLAKAMAASGILEGRELVIVTDSKKISELFRFYNLSASFTQRVFPSDSIVDGSKFEATDAILVPMGHIQLQTNCYLMELDGFVYFDCANMGR